MQVRWIFIAFECDIHLTKTADHRARVYIGAQALCCRISQVENELYTVSELFLGRSCVLA